MRKIIESFIHLFVDYILGNSDYKDKASKVILSIADLEYNAFKLILGMQLRQQIYIRREERKRNELYKSTNRITEKHYS